MVINFVFKGIVGLSFYFWAPTERVKDNFPKLLIFLIIIWYCMKHIILACLFMTTAPSNPSLLIGCGLNGYIMRTRVCVCVCCGCADPKWRSIYGLYCIS